VSFRGFNAPKDRPLDVNQVFGVQRSLPANYVERVDVDDRLVESLRQRQHIVIYGSSKQGKTSLRKWVFTEQSYILISCVNIKSVAQLHLAILKEAGYKIVDNVHSSGTSSTVKLSFGANWPGGVNPNIEWQDALTDQLQVSSHSLDLDPTEFNDVIGALGSIRFSRYIILEDYHYLPEDIQAEFAKLLKAYYDYSDYCFIVIGVWLDEYRLVRFAGDLRERSMPISVDQWSREQLSQAIAKGAELLNIEFDDDFVVFTLDHCFDSIWVVQRVCNRACIESNVLTEQADFRRVGSLQLAEKLIRDVIASQSARSIGFIDGFSAGPAYESRIIFTWITLAILASDPEYLERGLELDQIKSFIDTYRLEGYIDLVTLRMSLEQVTWFQMEIVRINPIVVDYDKTARRLNIVDREFLIWLSGQDRADLLKRHGMRPKSLNLWIENNEKSGQHRDF
jgi:hypothetical protein